MNRPESQNLKADAPAVIHCEIRDEFGDVESAATVLTSNEAYHWYEEHGASFHAVKMSENGFTFQRPAAAQPALDGNGRIEPMNSYDYGQFNPTQTQPAIQPISVTGMTLDELCGPAAAQPATCPKCGVKSNSEYKCPNCFALLPAQPAKAAHEIDYKVGDKIIRARSYEEAVAKLGCTEVALENVNRTLDKTESELERVRQERDSYKAHAEALVAEAKALHYQMALGPIASYPKPIVDALVKLEKRLAAWDKEGK